MKSKRKLLFLSLVTTLQVTSISCVFLLKKHNKISFAESSNLKTVTFSNSNSYKNNITYDANSTYADLYEGKNFNLYNPSNDGSYVHIQKFYSSNMKWRYADSYFFNGYFNESKWVVTWYFIFEVKGFREFRWNFESIPCSYTASIRDKTNNSNTKSYSKNANTKTGSITYDNAPYDYAVLELNIYVGSQITAGTTIQLNSVTFVYDTNSCNSLS